MGKLTEQQLKDKIYDNTLKTCEYLSGYTGKAESNVVLKCLIHNYVFETKYENVRRADRAHYVCPFCQQDHRNQKYNKERTELECAYCHKKFFRSNSKLKNSKSELYFCCREHKDLAQRISSGETFNIMRPEHYGNFEESTTNYRAKAFANYENKCAVCGYDEEPAILQVHHIDENRQNNKLSNLIILCPNCHAKLTWGNIF